MRRRVWMIVAMLLVGLVALTGCGEKAPEVDWELRVTGAVENEMAYSYSELVGRDLQEFEGVLMERSEGDPSESTWTGIALSEMLDEAGASADASAVIFRAADEYEREVPMSDVSEAIVAVKEEGAWLTEDEKAGPIRIVIPGLPGSRWVGQLVEIEVLE